jgi:hypothetical protein
MCLRISIVFWQQKSVHFPSENADCKYIPFPQVGDPGHLDFKSAVTVLTGPGVVRGVGVRTRGIYSLTMTFN